VSLTYRPEEFVIVIVKKGWIKGLSPFLAAILLCQMIGCGTLIYPEGKGQTGGRIDPGIAILDAAGLLLFIIPGVIAFGVDFTTGAIYLPSKAAKANTATGQDGIVVIKVNPEDLNFATLEKALQAQTGEDIRLTFDELQVCRLNRGTTIQAKLGEAVP
jgi:hypothetical protein